MRIRYVTGPQMGTEQDLPDPQAQVLIARGFAVALAPTVKKPVAKKKATPKRKP